MRIAIRLSQHMWKRKFLFGILYSVNRGGRLDYDDFEDLEHVDFYGVHLLLDQLEVITENWETLSFQKIAQIVKNDLQRAQNSCPEMFVLLRSEYQKYTLMTEENAKKLLDY